MTDPPTIISVTEAAQQAGVSGALVRRWLMRGSVLGRKAGGRTCAWLVDAASLTAYAATTRKRGCPVGRRWKWKKRGEYGNYNN